MLLQIIPTDGKINSKVKFAVKSFSTINLFIYVEETPDVQWRIRKKWNDKEHHKEASFSLIQLSLTSYVVSYVICLCEKTFKPT